MFKKTELWLIKDNSNQPHKTITWCTEYDYNSQCIEQCEIYPLLLMGKYAVSSLILQFPAFAQVAFIHFLKCCHPVD